MATRVQLQPLSARLLGTVFPNSDRDGVERYYLDIDPTLATPQVFEWSFQVPTGWTTPIQFVFTYRMPTVNTGTLDISFQVEAISPGEPINTITTRSFSSANVLNGTTVPGTIGVTGQITLNLTTDDGALAGDLFTIRGNFVNTGTAAGNVHYLDGEIRDAS